MPNNTACHIIARGNPSEIEDLIKKHFDDKTMDFNTIVPMPKELKNITDSSVRSWGFDLMQNKESVRSYIIRRASEMNVRAIDDVDMNQLSHGDIIALALDVEPEIVSEGMDAMRCLEEYGATSWYDWSIDNWGTKWNAYDGEYEVVTHPEKESTLNMHFSTAWSPASPAISALANMYPNVVFNHHFLDEGGGFAGTEIYAEGLLKSNSEHDWAWFAQSHFDYDLSDDE